MQGTVVLKFIISPKISEKGMLLLTKLLILSPVFITGHIEAGISLVFVLSVSETEGVISAG